MMEGGQALDGLSEDDATYYFGLLSKKTHKSVKAKLLKEEAERAKMAETKLFRVEKVPADMRTVQAKS